MIISSGKMRVPVLALAAALCGCAGGRVDVNTGSAGARSVPGAGGSVTTSRIQASVETRLGAAIIIGIMLADGIRYFRVGPDGTRAPIDAAEALRMGLQPPRVNVQDCTQPVDLEAGNLACR